jgi:AcrR family transcriptional regulator
MITAREMQGCMPVRGKVQDGVQGRDQVQEVDLPGVTPSRQKRSREMTLALLQAGAEMLRTHSLSELSIEALCKKVGATVGAFYSRFESKQAYFNALIELAARDGDRGLSLLAEKELFKGVDLAGLCGILVSGITAWIRNHEGVLRATLQHGGARPDRWTPFKHRGRAMTERATSLLLAAMGNGREAAKRRSIAFGFQLVFGTLVNAILNDPGPISLCDPEMEARLGRCLLQTLQAEMTAPPARRGRHAPR